MKATNRTGDNEATQKRLITKIYKQLTQLNTKTKNNMLRRSKKTFLQRRHTD